MMYVLGFRCLRHSNNNVLEAARVFSIVGATLQHIAEDHYVRYPIEGDRPRYNNPFVEKNFPIGRTSDWC
jgi:hypothetical protein